MVLSILLHSIVFRNNLICVGNSMNIRFSKHGNWKTINTFGGIKEYYRGFIVITISKPD